MKKKREQYKVLNRHFILFVSLVAVLLVLSVACSLANETDVSLFLLISAVAVSLGIFLSPIYFVFSSKSLTAVWLLPFKKTIHWNSVNAIIECKLFSAVDDLAHYEIMYLCRDKGQQTIRQLDLPRNKRTRKLMERYAGHKIV